MAKPSTQLDLAGDELPVGVTLTGRQRQALEFVRDRQPVSAEEVGAYLHELKRCRWCRPPIPCKYAFDAGKDVLKALRVKGLVKQRRGAGWVLRDAPRNLAPTRATQGDLPEDF